MKTLDEFLEQIPEKYRNNVSILGEFKGYRSDVRYKNECGHYSNTKLGYLFKRKQFDYCSECESLNRKKTVNDYIDLLPSEVKSSIIKIHKDLGRYTKISVQYPCGCIKNLKLHTILQNGLLNCRCKPYNQLSESDMILYLSEYMDNINLIKGFPGNKTSELSGTCKVCGSVFKSKFFNLQQYFKYHKTGCPNCNVINLQQKEVIDFVTSLIQNVEINNRTIVKFDTNKYKELDIYCCNEKFAIEYNGLLWHSDLYQKDSQYHWKKTLACKDKGIILLHIWGDKYLNNKDIYHSIIKVKLGKIQNKIFARKTKVKQLEKNQIKQFFGKNHLDGNVNCITGWGLFYQDELIQAISIRKVNSQNKKYKGYLEIARSATLLNQLVIGGESKLLDVVEKYAYENNFKGILNYVTCDFGGFPKQKWKFKYQGVTDVSYFYTDGIQRVSRQKLQKRKFGQSEKELANELNLFKVYGTPNLIYVYSF